MTHPSFRCLARRHSVSLPSWLGYLAGLLTAYFLARIFFLVLNLSLFAEASASQLLEAFWWGLRFDLSFLFIFNAPFLLLAFFPRRRPWAGEMWFMWLLNLIPLWWNLGDAAYFGFQGRRSTWGLLSLWGDFRDQFAQLALHFWFVPVACVVLALGLAGWFRWWHARAPLMTARLWQLLLVAPVSIVVVAVVVRGGLGSKPLGTWHAMKLPSTALGNLALNTPFHVIHTNPAQAVVRRPYFPTLSEARAVVEGPLPVASAFPANRSNVVVIILESFSLENFGYRDYGPGYMPFLRSLADRGAYFENNFANARQSIDAVASLLGGVPSLMVEPYVSSLYNGNRLRGLGHALAEQGYGTHFFHGGRNGSMYIDVMARLAGFEKYYGMNQYPDPHDFDGVWGIFDEPFLQYVARTLNDVREPFAAGVFTLSSHNPYTIPSGLQGRFPKGTHKIHESLGYADFALRRFFESAEKMPWYRNTLFVLTGDHTSDGNLDPLRTPLGRYRVPLVFFHPGGLVKAQKSDRVTQHVDVPASILDVLGWSPALRRSRLLPFGRSAFEPSLPGRVVNRTGQDFWMVSDGVVGRLAVDGDETSVSALEPTLLGETKGAVPSETGRRVIRELRAYIQFYMNGLADNAWFQN